MSENPLVSIIVRTKDRPVLLKRALQSIAEQTYRPIEVVLVNDGGCDLDMTEINDILDKIVLKYIRLEKNSGRAHAGNVGIENSTGAYAGFLDDDDELYPEHVGLLADFLNKSELSVGYSDSMMVYKDYDPQGGQLREYKSELVFSEDFNYDKLIFENYIPLMCLMFRREVLTQVGGFDENFDLYEDWDLLLRAGSKYPFQHIRKISANYNQWDSVLQISQKNNDSDFMKRSYLKVLNKHFGKITAARIHQYVSAFVNMRYILKTYFGEVGISMIDFEEKINKTIEGLQRALQDKVQDIDRLSHTLQERGFEIASLNGTLREREAYISEIHSGRGWRLLTKHFRIRDRLLPSGTRRRLFVKLLLRATLNPKDLFRRINKTNFKKFIYHLGNTDPLTIERKVEQKLSDESALRDGAASDMAPRHASGAVGTDYFRYLFDMNVKKGEEYVPIASPKLPETDIRLIAFYLPQFHPIPENDEWWGKGFTEWYNVSRAIPQFIGHYQPHLPGELGFYDLRIKEVQARQIELALQYGVSGFCFHFYWFNGKTLLEGPIRQFAENYEFPFCINWANENWTRRWDGESNEILIAQKHSPEDDIHFIEYVSGYLRKKQYIRIDSKPLLIIYRPSLFPDPLATARRWREWCRDNGIGEIFLALTHSFEHVEPETIGFDAAIEFPPNTFPLSDISDRLNIINLDYKGVPLDYEDAINYSMHQIRPHYKKFRGVCPGWDNEARRPGRGTVLVNSTPKAYKRWLRGLCDYTIRNFEPQERLIFINAWNEWAESAYLEPDRRYGYAYLQATAEALAPSCCAAEQRPDSWKILFVSHDACRAGAQSVILNIISWFKRHTFVDLKILCIEGGELLPRFRELGETLVLSELRSKGLADDKLSGTLKDFCNGSPDLVYCNSVASGREYRLLKLLEAPLLMHFHEMEMSIQRYASSWIDEVVEGSSYFIAVSGAVRESLAEKHGVARSKISTVYSSIMPECSLKILDDREKQALRKRLGLKKDRCLVFGCGVGMPFRKGADLFIRAARILKGQGHEDFHFYWIGEFDRKERDDAFGVWGDYLASLKRDDLHNHITFLGFKNNPREYLQAGDIFLLTSREEPLGLVGLEAAECGLPVICFADAGGMPEFIGEDAGFIVPYEDASAMAEKVAMLKNNEGLRRKLGDGARTKVLSHFTTEHTNPHILSVCRMVARRKPAVSVIIPNFNHARYLVRRLESVFNQTFADFEVIILDDASEDNSMEVIEKYADHAGVMIERNAKNSESPFRQWLKGMDLAKADIIWIAESDDICDPGFLETLLPAFDNPEVKLAYANSHVIDENDKITGDYESGEYLTSLSQTKWKKNYLVDATAEINECLGVKDTILNISAVLFRKPLIDEKFREMLQGMRIAGDWYFVVNTIMGGKIYYDAAKLNYHRRHAESVIGRTVTEKKMENFFHEFLLVQDFIFEHYALNEHFCHKWESYLQKQWNDFFPGRPFEELQKYYPLVEMREKILRNANGTLGVGDCEEDSIYKIWNCRKRQEENIVLLREIEDSLTMVKDSSTISIKKLLENVSDEFYFWLLTEGHAHISSDALLSLLPTMPDEQIQINWTGRSGYETLHQAFLAFSLFKEIIGRHYQDIRSCNRILDFGCGWGRIIRFFLKDIEPGGLWGIDCYEEAVAICNNSNLKCNFESIDVMPPTTLPDDYFDAIYLYSVFSHLSEEAHMAWLMEFKRILKPGGIVIATTRPRHFLIECDTLRNRKDVKEFQHGAVASFQNINDCLSDYDNGSFCHSPTGGGGVLSTSFYGETAIPREYALEHWKQHYSLVDYMCDDEHKSFDQNVIIAKK
ncbi:MAG: glycoside hydrolase family 99-like domain-containing protein [Nitrospirae bacterium]|nr:glycoside hydrolase family 99-like domain-containing protein [Nitrospirota bacterium]